MKAKLLSRKWRLSHLYKIVDKNWKSTTFRPNKIQKKLIDLENKLRKKYGKVRLIILKARQMGLTTYKLIDKLDKCLFVPNTTVNIVAHNKDKLEEIFAKVKYAYSSIPDKIQTPSWVWHKPKPKYDTKTSYYFPSLNSKISITLDARSGTLTDLHISEMAFINDAQEMLRGTLPAAENADITIETTANGMNYFYKFRCYHRDNSDSEFETVFFPWYE